MDNLVKCTRCQKVMIDEEYDCHICLPKIKDWKKIKYVSFYTYKDEKNRNVLSIRALNGINYEFVEIPENKEYTKIPYQPPVNTNKDNHEVNSTLLSKPVHWGSK